MDAKLSGDLSSAHAHVMMGMDLVSSGLDQLSVCRALLHFGGEPRKVPALALLPLPGGPKCCSYSMNPGPKLWNDLQQGIDISVLVMNDLGSNLRLDLGGSVPFL